jgi:hypothetical protein
MPRTARDSQGGYCYHVLNRGNARGMVLHNAGVLRYVERNTSRAGLVERVELWPWGRLSSVVVGRPALDVGHVPRPVGWLNFIKVPVFPPR